MFLSFLLRLLAGAVVPLLIFSVMEMSQFGLIALTFPRLGQERTVRARALDALRGLVQAYIWFGWAAYCVTLAIRYSQLPTTTQAPWVYYLTAALAANVPIVYLAIRERMAASSDEERSRLREGTNLCRAITMVGFFLFAIAPSLMATPYGWILAPSQSYDVDMTVEQLIEAAEQGAPEAQHMLATMYSEGRGVSPSAAGSIKRLSCLR